MSNLPHACVNAVAAKQVLLPGVSMLTTIISSAVSAAIAGGLGWYVAKRGNQGVINDLNNAKAELEKVKTQATAAVNAAQTVA